MKNAMRWKFGLSLDAPDLPAAFGALPPEWSGLKLSFRLWETLSASRLRRFQRFERIIGDLAERRLCALTPGENLRLRMDFLELLASRFRQVAGAGVAAGSCAFDLSAAQDPACRQALLGMLRSICGGLDSSETRLLLPFRIPGGGMGPAELGDLLRELPGRNLAVLAELHPHEPGFSQLPSDLLRPLGRQVWGVECVYEPGTGNRLTAKLLGDLLRTLSGANRPVSRVFFRPLGLEPDAWESEVAELTALVRELAAE